MGCKLWTPGNCKWSAWKRRKQQLQEIMTCQRLPVRLPQNIVAVQYRRKIWYRRACWAWSDMAEKKEEKPNPGPSQNSTPQQNELTCSLCSKTFRSRTGFREHEDKHVVGSKSHFCPVVDCERKFTTITTLQRHIASKHQGIKISACQCNIKDKFEEKHCYKSWLVTNLYVLL